jgi:hypothetical protein
MIIFTILKKEKKPKKYNENTYQNFNSSFEASNVFFYLKTVELWTPSQFATL